VAVFEEVRIIGRLVGRQDIRWRINFSGISVSFESYLVNRPGWFLNLPALGYEGSYLCLGDDFPLHFADWLDDICGS